MHIISIGYDIHSVDNYSLTERVSLSDADLVVFSPSMDDYFTDQKYLGKANYLSGDAVTINEDIDHWKRELANYLSTGKPIFLFLIENEEFFLHKNRANNYQYLPVQLDITNARGTGVLGKIPLATTFTKALKGHLSFSAYISLPQDSIELFTTRNKAHCLGGIMNELGGYLISIPYIDVDEYDFLTELGDAWNEQGVSFCKSMISVLVQMQKSILKESSKTPTPSWIDDEHYQLTSSNEFLRSIEEINDKMAMLQEAKDKYQHQLNEINSFKDLLYESGKPLEVAVISSLKLLSYHAESYDDGTLELDSIIMSPEGLRYIGECEGKDNKEIDITKFRQLQDALNEDFDREEVDEKAFGLLFGNPQRLIPPDQRTLTFTKKCMNGANREKTGLILTKDLFKVAQYLIDNNDEDYKRKCRKAIYDGLGGLIEFPDTPKQI